MKTALIRIIMRYFYEFHYNNRFYRYHSNYYSDFHFICYFFSVKEKNIHLKISIPYNSDCSIDKIVLDFDSINMEKEAKNNVRLSKLL